VTIIAAVVVGLHAQTRAARGPRAH